MHILNLYGIQIFCTLLSYRSWEILNQFAARKHSAEMRSRGSLSLMCILMQIILLKRNHIQMWLELCICIHPTMETVWMLSSGDLCTSMTAALPQYAEVAHLDRSYPGFHMLNGSWEARELSHSGWAVLIRPSLASETSGTCGYRPLLKVQDVPLSLPK